MEDKTALILVGGALVLGYWATKKAAEGVHDVAQAVNPLNNNNIFYRGTNEIGSVITGDNNFNLGVWIYDALHPNQNNNSAIKLPTQGGGGASGQW